MKQKLIKANDTLLEVWSLLCAASSEAQCTPKQDAELRHLMRRIDAIQAKLLDLTYPS